MASTENLTTLSKVLYLCLKNAFFLTVLQRKEGTLGINWKGEYNQWFQGVNGPNFKICEVSNSSIEIL